MIIYRGDQYAIPFIIRLGSTPVTPDIVDDVRIQVGSDLRELLEQSLTFNPDKNSWDFYVTEEFTRMLTNGTVPYQVGIKMGDDIRYSQRGRLKIDDNIIEAVWSDA